MIVTEGIKQLSDFIGVQESYDWDYCAKRFRKHPDFELNREYTLREYARAFKDIGMLNFLERAGEESGLSIKTRDIYFKGVKLERDFLNRVYVPPMPILEHGREVGRLSYPLIYNNIVSVNGDVLIVESCLDGFPEGKSVNAKKSFMSRVFSEFGYLIAIPDYYTDFSSAKNFRRQGGVTPKLPVKGDGDFRKQLREFLENNDFLLKRRKRKARIE